MQLLGRERDLTREVNYKVNDDTVASVDANGLLSAKRSGETAVMIRSLGADPCGSRTWIPDEDDGLFRFSIPPSAGAARPARRARCVRAQSGADRRSFLVALAVLGLLSEAARSAASCA